MTATIHRLKVVITDCSAGLNISLMLLVAGIAIVGFLPAFEAVRTQDELSPPFAALSSEPSRVFGKDGAGHPLKPWVAITGTILATLLGVALTVGSACKAKADVEKHRRACAEIESLARSHAQELGVTVEKLARAEAVKSDFLSIMSHELRTPLNTIIGYTQLLLEEPPSSQLRREYLEAILSGGDALRGVIHEVLDFSSVDRGSINIQQEPVDIRQLVRKVLLAMRPPHLCERLVAEIDESLPARILTDENKLRQVILNLVANALKFAPTGQVTVRCGMEKDGQRLAVKVIDDGIGMAEAQIHRLFEPFLQTEPATRRRSSGVGLGLAICQRFIEAMGGSITAKSQPGKGTHISFWLPLRPAAVDESAGHEIGLTPDGLGSLRCLVVDDNQVNRKLMVTLLARLGMKPLSAGSGEECLAVFRQVRLDVIFMDLDMPEMDGFDTTLEIRRMETSRGISPVPVIALTADVLEGVRQRCAQTGMNGFLAKPIRAHELTAVLHSLPGNCQAGSGPLGS
ncbi:signal transduction histidine kinase [Terrimicrobium sacchariphilum]|uniref:histidine kinase n=1 Tax=Terrimicrobium sacchariphilum TaxID=690879 RepID=A0A146G348_TERSA|nr:ATP-binding protein [Terrimicrobium sacchariphilum]GAT31902.1 signal transduction histidine kinase [Terrimicrobium sacchariphilum]